jgi:hypothetical protein
MRKLAMVVAVLGILVPVGAAHAALDCPRVQKLNGEGKRPADIARELGVTTPEVQECLAGDGEQQAPAAADANRLPLAQQAPSAAVNPVPRGPNQQ